MTIQELKNEKEELQSSERWGKEFDENVNELRRDLAEGDGEGEVHKFGYKVKRGNELFTVPDWGNVKSFIRSLLESARKEEREKAEKNQVEADIGWSEATAKLAEKIRKEERERLREDLIKVLNFVERWNKQDKEIDVAEAAQRLCVACLEEEKE
jgi:hypothetical protein